MNWMSTGKRAELAESLTTEVRKFIAGAILFNEKVAASIGLNGTDLQFLHLLELREAATPGDFARWSGLTTGGVTVVLDRLERAGYIKRKPNPTDRRSTIVRPAAAQVRKIQSFYRSKSALPGSAVAESSEGELAVLLNFFSRANRGGREDGSTS
jgi:MarR family transcriptional regulator, organic hydroperoxide resistance regulator